MQLLNTTLDYAGGSNPVADRTDDPAIQSLTFLHCCDEVDFCGCVFIFTTSLVNSFSVSAAKALVGRPSQEENGSSERFNMRGKATQVGQEPQRHGSVETSLKRKIDVMNQRDEDWDLTSSDLLK
ncbi:hypothetical protein EYF80_031857 [Liparis tanakae]|uniref:Uncharacterized protein n=1 Tax=Liparis tanakae TaxID=230148 RepID=A0A4Z2GXA1_9TELE|nr:hypothetical protein EYF80_031857 [Liparis tanakae]